MRNFSLLFKIAFLLLALVGVLFMIRSMTPESVQKAFLALGIEPSAPGQAGFQPAGRELEDGEERRTLCRTRLKAVRYADGRAVEELKKGLKGDWVAWEEGKKEPRSIGYLDVEKWLSQHCQFIVSEPLDKPPGPAVAITFEFIDGTSWKLEQSGASFLPVLPVDPKSEARTPFYSPDLASALKELRELAGFPVDSAAP